MDTARTARKKRPPADDAAGDEQQASARDAALLRVQRLAGNRAASALTGVAPADRNEPADVVQRQVANEQAANGAAPGVIGPEGGEVDNDTAARVESASGGGSALDPAVRSSVEGVTGTSLSDVRLHENSESNALAEKFGAAAFTVGRDIFFGRQSGAPDSPERQHVLAHELGHTVQDTGTARRSVVRRLLTDDAARAFKTAEAANPSFEEPRKVVDLNVSASDQKKLTKLHGFMHNAKKESDQDKALADAIRAIVLSEYAQRIDTLTKNDKLNEKEKSKKRSVYIKKADEFREKVAPLMKKGAAAPETRMLLADFGLDTVAEATKKQTAKVISAGPRIDVRSTFIGGPILGVRVRAHLFIVYTSREGKQMYFRGGPDDDGTTRADWGEYGSETVDYDPSAPSVTVMEGPEAAGKLDRLIEATSVISGMKVPYQAQISKEFGGDKPNLLQKAASYGAMLTSNEGENCNATAWTILTRAGIKPSKPMGKHPGWGSILGAHTPGKENALPPPEAQDPSKKRKYRFDPDRDEMSKRGMVQIYHDRACVERQSLVNATTEVELLEEGRNFRKVLVHGKVGYVARSEKERGRMSMQRLLTRMLSGEVTGLNLKAMAEAPDDAPHAHTKWLANEWEIDEERIVAAARLQFKKADEKLGDRLEQKLELYGAEKLKVLLRDPVEVDELARETGARPDQVLDAIVAFVGHLDLQEKVAAALGKHLEMKQQMYMFASDIPKFTVLNQVAKECGTDLQSVFDVVCEMMPKGIVPLGELVDDLSNRQLREIASGKNKVLALRLAEQARVPVEFVVKRVGDYVGPEKKPEKIVEAPKKMVTEDDKKLKLYVDIPRATGFPPNAVATGPSQVLEVDRTEGEWAWVKTTLDYFPFWARVDELERFREAHGAKLKGDEDGGKDKNDTASEDDNKKLKMFIDIPRNVKMAPPSQVATSPDQIEAVVQDDGKGWLYVKTTLDQFPFWVQVADLQLFAVAHGVDLDDDVEDSLDDMEDDSGGTGPVEDVKPLTAYIDDDEGSQKWGDVVDPQDVIVVTEHKDWVEITFKFEGSFVWVKRDELEAWEMKHGHKARR